MNNKKWNSFFVTYFVLINSLFFPYFFYLIGKNNGQTNIAFGLFLLPFLWLYFKIIHFAYLGVLYSYEKEMLSQENGLEMTIEETEDNQESYFPAPPFQYRKPQNSTNGMASIMGKYPGNETDEQIEKDIERMS